MNPQYKYLLKLKLTEPLAFRHARSASPTQPGLLTSQSSSKISKSPPSSSQSSLGNAIAPTAYPALKTLTNLEWSTSKPWNLGTILRVPLTWNTHTVIILWLYKHTTVLLIILLESSWLLQHLVLFKTLLKFISHKHSPYSLLIYEAITHTIAPTAYPYKRANSRNLHPVQLLILLDYSVTDNMCSHSASTNKKVRAAILSPLEAFVDLCPFGPIFGSLHAIPTSPDNRPSSTLALPSAWWEIRESFLDSKSSDSLLGPSSPDDSPRKFYTGSCFIPTPPTPF